MTLMLSIRTYYNILFAARAYAIDGKCPIFSAFFEQGLFDS